MGLRSPYALTRSRHLRAALALSLPCLYRVARGMGTGLFCTCPSSTLRARQHACTSGDAPPALRAAHSTLPPSRYCGLRALLRLAAGAATQAAAAARCNRPPPRHLRAGQATPRAGRGTPRCGRVRGTGGADGWLNTAGVVNDSALNWPQFYALNVCDVHFTAGTDLQKADLAFYKR